MVFAAEIPLHGFVKGALSDAELEDGLVFAIATLVIWPQLPDHPIGPFGAINLYRLWLVVVLVLSIGALPVMRPRGSSAADTDCRCPVSRQASFPSTAAIGSMAGRAAQDPTSMRPAVAGGAFSTVATFVQMAVLLSMISRPTLLDPFSRRRWWRGRSWPGSMRSSSRRVEGSRRMRRPGRPDVPSVSGPPSALRRCWPLMLCPRGCAEGEVRFGRHDRGGDLRWNRRYPRRRGVGGIPRAIGRSHAPRRGRRSWQE